MNKNVLARLATLTLTACLASTLNAAPGPRIIESTGDLSEDAAADLVFMREEEKLARDSYLAMLEKWGLPIFGNIAQSEQRHMDAIENLIGIYGLADPVLDEKVIAQFVDPELQDLYEVLMELGGKSALDGLIVGAMIEETDIEDILYAIDQAAGHQDITQVYENLLCGSLNHLRAFVTQIKFNGGSYVPMFLTTDEFSAIVDQPIGRDCEFSGGPDNRGTTSPYRKGRN